MIINSREDLDAIAGTPEHAEYMRLLAGTLWHLERDDENKRWVVVENNSMIERFGFSRADFPDAQPMDVPEYVATKKPSPEVVTMRQFRLALLRTGKLAMANAKIMSMPLGKGEEMRIEWEYTHEVHKDSVLVKELAKETDMTPEDIDSLFELAASL